MCSYCGCREVGPLAELMDEHSALLDLAGHLRRDLCDGDPEGATARLAELAEKLLRHVAREERGVFAALREQGDYADAVAGLEAEHLAFDVLLDGLDPDSPRFGAAVAAMLDDLALHIDQEDNGLFPATVVTLGARGWATVGAAHEVPGFLTASG